MNRKRQLLRELFVNALTIALVKQLIMANVAAETEDGEVIQSPEPGFEGHDSIPPWYLG